MVDDGIIVNFAIPESFTHHSSQPKFKGGSWRERMRLKKNGTISRPKNDERSSTRGAEAAFKRAIQGPNREEGIRSADSRPQKKRRENGTFTPSTERSQLPTLGSIRSAVSKKPQYREVISSLFSYNPQPKAADNDEAVAWPAPSKPSNAPLPDGADTFVSLGLAPVLASHLITKMSLKTPTAIQKTSISKLVKEDTDAFIQSETGSGKTLAYLLPIVQRLMDLAEKAKASSANVSHQALHRDSGLFAIVLAPTRELCKQISVVLDKLLGCANYIVAGTVIGGEKKKSEKARLRKGLNILVATPGRLVDHLENTESLDVGQVRYLVLDEGDRMMDLGFEEDMARIVKTLDSKMRKNIRNGMPERRITMLCSATLKMNVQRLGDISLKDAIHIVGEHDDRDEQVLMSEDYEEADKAFLAPAQLKQSYIVAAAKLRLVTLTALLRRTFARKGSVMKAIVFISCADSVEFHFKTLTRTSREGQDAPITPSHSPADQDMNESVKSAPLLSSAENPVSLYKLHGSLPQQVRTGIIKAFASTTSPSLLLATDVASRGLDLPNLDLVVEYDPAFAASDHLHRIGRTARLGRDGRAIVFLLPGNEESYVSVLEASYKKSDGNNSSRVTSTSADEILRKGFMASSGISSGKEWEQRATDFQLDIERDILADTKYKDLAKQAFQSHIRAYATHTASERKYFDIKQLHLGHLAKSFGLRDPPGRVNIAGMRGRASVLKGRGEANVNESRKRKGHHRDQDGDAGDAAVGGGRRDREVDVAEFKAARRRTADIDEVGDIDDAAKRMKDMVRNRKKMMGAGAEEFNLA